MVDILIVIWSGKGQRHLGPKAKLIWIADHRLGSWEFRSKKSVPGVNQVS
jgi:hypothetical protein